jgi:L-threonylcarbamoyladenylate synthase
MAESSQSIQQAAQLLQQGGVIAYPTEAVWGLGCDPFDRDAVSRILELKSRSADKGLILVGAAIEQFSFLLDGLADNLLAQLRASWPGPTTWLVPHQQHIPAWIHGNHETVAIRVTAHNTAAQLCNAFGGPIVSTSANPQGKPPAKTPSELRSYFGDQLDAIVPGALGSAQKPSTICDLLTGEIIRGAK